MCHSLDHPLTRCFQILQTAEALVYLKEEGNIHGDMKASNILVGDDYRAKLCDFGLAKFATVLTASPVRGAGSCRWQSPELWQPGARRTYASDVYAFGITIFEVGIPMFAKKRAFIDRGAQILSRAIPFAHCQKTGEVILSVFKEQRPSFPPEYHASMTDKQFLRVARRCWVKKPQKRPRIEEALRLLREIPQ